MLVEYNALYNTDESGIFKRSTIGKKTGVTRDLTVIDVLPIIKNPTSVTITTKNRYIVNVLNKDCLRSNCALIRFLGLIK